MWPSADDPSPLRSETLLASFGRNTALVLNIVLRCAQRTTPWPAKANRKTVILWRKRSPSHGLRDRTRPGRKPTLSAEFSNASSIQRFTRSPGRPRIGAPAPSPSTWASPRWPSSASGKRTDCSPIASKLLSRDKQFVEKLRRGRAVESGARASVMRKARSRP